MYWGGLEQAGGLCRLQSPGPALGLLRLKPRLSLGLILHARHELASFKLALGHQHESYLQQTPGRFLSPSHVTQ